MPAPKVSERAPPGSRVMSKRSGSSYASGSRLPLKAHTITTVPSGKVMSRYSTSQVAILAVNGERVEDFPAVAEALAGRKDQQVTLTVEREGRRFDLPVTTNAQGQIGIRPPEEIVAFGPGEAVVRASEFLVAGTLSIVTGIVSLIRGEATGGLVGPVGIASETATIAVPAAARNHLTFFMIATPIHSGDRVCVGRRFSARTPPPAMRRRPGPRRN